MGSYIGVDEDDSSIVGPNPGNARDRSRFGTKVSGLSGLQPLTSDEIQGAIALFGTGTAQQQIEYGIAQDMARLDGQVNANLEAFKKDRVNEMRAAVGLPPEDWKMSSHLTWGDAGDFTFSFGGAAVDRVVSFLPNLLKAPVSLMEFAKNPDAAHDALFENSRQAAIAARDGNFAPSGQLLGEYVGDGLAGAVYGAGANWAVSRASSFYRSIPGGFDPVLIPNSHSVAVDFAEVSPFLRNEAPRTLSFATTDPVAITGTRAIELGHSYEVGVRGLYGDIAFQERQYTAIVDGRRVNGVADTVTSIAGRDTAVEAKFVDDWATSLRNPSSTNGGKPWAVKEQQTMINQAAKYSAGFDGGVIYHTNSSQLASHYSQVFNNAGISNFRFVITPVTKH